MKTSNKILLGGALVALILFTTALVYQLNAFKKNTIKGNGKMVTRTYSPADFNQIKASYFDCEFIPSDKNLIEAQIDENLKNIVVTQVKDGVLKISLQRGSYVYTKRPILKIYYKNVDALSFSASKCSGKFTNPDFKLKLSAGARADLQLECDNASIKISSGANGKLTGKIGDAEISASSGSRLKAKELILTNCNVKMSSGANASINVSGSLTGKISSGANLNYYGSPTKNSISTSSGGNINAGD